MDYSLTKNKYSLLLKGSTIFLVGLGTLVMLGWVLKIIPLVQILPSFAPMQFNTALCFILSGIIIYLCSYQKYILANVMVALLLIIPLSTLIEYFFVVTTGIDTFFIEPFINTKTSNPGRMAPNTALCFVLFSFFVYLSQIRFNKLLLLVALLPCVIGVLGLISLIGYIFNIEQAYAWGVLTHMALHTSIAFIILSIASFVLLKKKKHLSKKQISNLVDYTLFSASLLFFLILWQIVGTYYVNVIKKESVNQVAVVSAKLSVQIDSDIEAIIRLFSRFSTNSYSDTAAFNRDVDFYFKQIKSLAELSFIKGKNNKIRMINPYFLPHAMHNQMQLCTETTKLGVGDLLHISSPNIKENLGYICVANRISTALINLTTIVSDYAKMESKNFVISIMDNGKTIFQNGREDSEHVQFWGVTKKFNLYGSNLSITVYPSAYYVQKSIGHILSLIQILGACISLLLLYVLRYRRKLITKEKALLSAEAIKSTILNSTLEGVFGVNKQLIIYFMNKSAQKLLGVHFDNVRKMALSEIISHESTENDLITTVIRSLREGKALTKDANLFIKSNGSSIPVRYSSSPIVEDNEITGVIIVFSDNSERLAYENKLHQLAHFDMLTQLPNRFSIISHLTECIARAKRQYYNFSLCFIDIDHFKRINDTYGHQLGDKALQYVSDRISDIIRDNDFLGRLSGDEFCLILDGIHLAVDQDSVLMKIAQAFEKPLIVGEIAIQIKLSIGVIPYAFEDTPEELLVKADEAMYRIKKQNKE